MTSSRTKSLPEPAGKFLMNDGGGLVETKAATVTLKVLLSGAGCQIVTDGAPFASEAVLPVAVSPRSFECCTMSSGEKTKE